MGGYICQFYLFRYFFVCLTISKDGNDMIIVLDGDKHMYNVLRCKEIIIPCLRN